MPRHHDRPSKDVEANEIFLTHQEAPKFFDSEGPVSIINIQPTPSSLPVRTPSDTESAKNQLMGDLYHSIDLRIHAVIREFLQIRHITVSTISTDSSNHQELSELLASSVSSIADNIEVSNIVYNSDSIVIKLNDRKDISYQIRPIYLDFKYLTLGMSESEKVVRGSVEYSEAQPKETNGGLCYRIMPDQAKSWDQYTTPSDIRASKITSYSEVGIRRLFRQGLFGDNATTIGRQIIMNANAVEQLLEHERARLAGEATDEFGRRLPGSKPGQSAIAARTS